MPSGEASSTSASAANSGGSRRRPATRWRGCRRPSRDCGSAASRRCAGRREAGQPSPSSPIRRVYGTPAPTRNQPFARSHSPSSGTRERSSSAAGRMRSKLSSTITSVPPRSAWPRDVRGAAPAPRTSSRVEGSPRRSLSWFCSAELEFCNCWDLTAQQVVCQPVFLVAFHRPCPATPPSTPWYAAWPCSRRLRESTMRAWSRSPTARAWAAARRIGCSARWPMRATSCRIHARAATG